MIYIFIFCL